MRIQTETLAKFLTYSGTLPLTLPIIFFNLQLPTFYTPYFTAAYIAIIISFLCGIHWAVNIFFQDKCPANLLITSNILTIIAWGSLFLPHPILVKILQILSFIYIFFLDIKLYHANILPKWFYNLRRNATIIVVLCLLLLMVLP